MKVGMGYHREALTTPKLSSTRRSSANWAQYWANYSTSANGSEPTLGQLGQNSVPVQIRPNSKQSLISSAAAGVLKRSSLGIRRLLPAKSKVSKSK
ncbi:hypothetical protein MUK42_29889 [Musa troglodytarum]|uniref:Uncharacterized protein n=1 Tax=Musa troglodytarum TaxID=320322 RepID=A0A9E7JYA7_9LILI|nr:hypothetical protein MUK42_29889 [Musa troglodytarum]